MCLPCQGMLKSRNFSAIKLFLRKLTAVRPKFCLIGHRLQATVIYIRQLHEVRETLPVSEAQCMNLVHVIFLHKENIPIFIGSCQAIAEILQKNQSFALILFDKGIHLQVCAYRESIAFFSCTFIWGHGSNWH